MYKSYVLQPHPLPPQNSISKMTTRKYCIQNSVNGILCPALSEQNRHTAEQNEVDICERSESERERTASASDLILKLGQRPLFTKTPLQTTPRRVFVQAGEEESDR